MGAARYTAERHARPAALSDLVMAFLESVPLDRFSGRSIAYELGRVRVTNGVSRFRRGLLPFDSKTGFLPATGTIEW